MDRTEGSKEQIPAQYCEKVEEGHIKYLIQVQGIERAEIISI